MNTCRIANLKAGGEGATKTAQSTYCWSCDTIRIQILNWSKKCWLLRSRFGGVTRCNGSVPGWNRSRNRPGKLDSLLTLLRDASVDFGIPYFAQPCCTQIEADWGHEVSGLVLGYDQNVLIDTIFITHHNGLLCYRQPFHCRTSVERLRHHCKVEYTDANHGIMPESHTIGVQYMDSDINITYQGQVPVFPVLYFSWTPPNQIFQFRDCLPAGKSISTFSQMFKNSPQ